MSVLPIGITDVRPVDPSRLQQDAARQAQTDPSATAPLVDDIDDVKAAEELSFGIAQRGRAQAAERETTLLNRKQHAAVLGRIYRISRLKGAYGTFDEAFWRNEVTPRAKDLLTSARSPGGRIERQSDTEQDDPFKRYLFLLEARQRAKGDEPAAKRLEEALDQIWDKHETEVAAGFNTMVPMLGFAKSLEEWDQFRGIYIDYVVPGELAKTFKALLDRFGPTRLRSAIDTLRNAIAADLSAPIVCADKTRWQQELLDLVDNRRISSLIASTADFCRELLERDPLAEMVMGFVSGALDFAAGPNERKLNALCALLVPEGVVDEIMRRRVRNYLKKYLPLWLWSSTEARDQMLFPAMYRAQQ